MNDDNFHYALVGFIVGLVFGLLFTFAWHAAANSDCTVNTVQDGVTPAGTCN